MTPMTEAEFWSKWWPAVAPRFSVNTRGELRCAIGDCPVVAAVREASGGAVPDDAHVQVMYVWRAVFKESLPEWADDIVGGADDAARLKPIRQRLLSFVPAAQGGLLEAQP